MMLSRSSSITLWGFTAAISLALGCGHHGGSPNAQSAIPEPALLPLDSTVSIDIVEQFAWPTRSLFLDGATPTPSGGPYYYIDADVSVQPGQMTVTINGIRHRDDDEDVIQEEASFGLPIDPQLTTNAVPPADGSKFRLDIRYRDLVDTYDARISSDTVTVTPVRSSGLSFVRTATWKRTPEELIWYYAIQFSSQVGYLGEVAPEVVQPLNDYLVNAGAQPWLLPAGYYKNLDLRVDDQGEARYINLSNPDQPAHHCYTFRYPGDQRTLVQQLREVSFPSPVPWIYYLNTRYPY